MYDNQAMIVYVFQFILFTIVHKLPMQFGIRLLLTQYSNPSPVPLVFVECTSYDRFTDSIVEE